MQDEFAENGDILRYIGSLVMIAFRLGSYQTEYAVSHSELRSQAVLGRLSTGVGDQLGTAW